VWKIVNTKAKKARIAETKERKEKEKTKRAIELKKITNE